MVHVEPIRCFGTPYYTDGSFDSIGWREVLHTALLSSGANEVISPFGFEVARDPKYLRGKIRNFYIYLASGENDPQKQQYIGEAFANNLVSIIKEKYVNLYEELYQIIIPGKKIEYHTGGYRTIYIRCREVKNGLLNEYASYLLATVGGIRNYQIKAINEFKNDPLSRRYLFQLAIIHNYIFEGDVPRLPSEQKSSLMEHIKRLHIADVSGVDRVNSTSSLEEQLALDNIVLPFADRLNNFINKSISSEDVAATLRVRDYHGPNELSIQISNSLLQEKIDYIVQSYQMFGEQIR